MSTLFYRFCFCALATLALLGRLDAIKVIGPSAHVICGYISAPLLLATQVDLTAQFVASCMNFDGGFGSRPGAESHAGLIYTCIGRYCIPIHYT